MPGLDTILLQTKLHKPRLPNDLVTRSRLIQLLNHDRSRPLTLVCAPAGFGKTTLIGAWLEQMPTLQGEQASSLPSAWLSLDDKDSDLTLFLQYFIAALRTIFSNACQETLELLQARRQPPQSVLYSTFINELENLPGEFILVLDDYHVIQGEQVHNLLGELARHWPKPLHLVLISRTSPPLPLSSLRARGMVSEIRTRDLRFTPEQTTAYLNQSQVALLNQEALPLLEERFEGWPAGLHLAALSLRSADSQESVLAALSSKNPNIVGYLVDEVLNHQLPAIHSFLLKTSILDRFCAALCEAVIGESDPAWNGRACLDWIERSELFLISLDNRREWHRYHHLFQELLQQRLSIELLPEEVDNLHLRASAWFEGQGLIDEAIQHALAAGNVELAARLMISRLNNVLNREDWPTLVRWLRLLPEEMIQQKPQLLMIRAWVLELTWRLDLQATIIEKIEMLLNAGAGAVLSPDELQIMRGQICMLKAQYAYFSNNLTVAIDLCQESLANLPPSWTFVRGAALLYLGLSLQATGEVQAAESLLLNEYESCRDKTEIYPLIILQTLGYIYLWTGQLDKARQIGRVLIQGATKSGITIMKNWGDYYLGVVDYDCNKLETAEYYFNEILNNRYIAHGSAYRDAVAGLALIYQIKGDSTQAWQFVNDISLFDLETSGSEDSRTSSLRARLMLHQGDLEGARRWAEPFSDPPPDQPIIWFEEPHVTRAKILVASGSEPDLQTALDILEIMGEIAERTHNIRTKIQVLALRALALDRQGRGGEADRLLKETVELAQPGGFIRVFVDLGRPMQAMLLRLAGQGYSRDKMRPILAAFPADKVNLPGDEGAVKPVRQRSSKVESLVEPLTPRELEILKLLRGPASIKEIAFQLHISYATAKRHTINIYAKLGVNQRWSAVAKAEELHIL